MNKVFINKNSNMVEQILDVKEGEVIQDDYFPNCYAIEDTEGNVNAYNLRYNKNSEEFEVVEGIKPKEDIEIIPSEGGELKKENERLENKISAMQSALDEIILNLI